MHCTDCHVHLWNEQEMPHLLEICDRASIDRVNLLSLTDRVRINDNPLVLNAKLKYPERFYAFGGLDHSMYHSGGRIVTPSLAEQVDRLIAIGADGIKMLENKPTTRKDLDIPVDSDYFEDYFEKLEETQMPVLWHVADPEEFWDPEKTPGWAKKRGWGYDETFAPKEQLYAEVERVLERHPKLVIIFGHFFFLSADLPRAARLLDRFGNVHFDLAPGIEMLYNMSKDVEASREFFVRHADRIIYGTDIMSSQSVDEACHRSGVVRRWLETGDTYRVPQGADYLLGPPEDGVIHGLSLPEDVLVKIYHENFQRLVGPEPKEVDAGLLADECRRIEGERGVREDAGKRLT